VNVKEEIAEIIRRKPVNEEDVVKFFQKEEDIEKIKKVLDLLLKDKTLKKKIIPKLEKIGNKCLSTALDQNSHLSVLSSLGPEEKKRKEKIKNLNLEKAKIFFSALSSKNKSY